MIDAISVNGGLQFINLLLSVHILIMSIILVNRATGRPHVAVAKATVLTFAILGAWTIVSRYFTEWDGETTELVVSFVATSLRFGLAIILTAWVWDVLEQGDKA